MIWVVFTAISAEASSCTDVFKTRSKEIFELSNENIELSGIKIIRDTSPQEIKTKKDPGYHESLKNLLMMLTETQFENITKNDLLKRGDLRLGKVFDDGLSLEFVYEGDIRGNNDFFFLKKIKLIKPNGKDHDIDEKPVPDIGMPAGTRTIIVKKEKSADETKTISVLEKELVDELIGDQNIENPEVKKKIEALTAQLKEVKVPFKLEGVVLDGLKKWSDLVPHVKRTTMRKRIEDDQITRMMWETRSLKGIRWMGQQLNRMLFRDIIRNAVLVGLVYNFMGPAFSEKVPAPIAPVAQTQSVSRDSQVIDLVADLAKKETDQKGSALFYTGSHKDSGVLLTAQAKDSNLIISVFPKQEKIVIIPDVKAGKEMTPIILDRTDNQKAYDFISDRMEDLYANRR